MLKWKEWAKKLKRELFTLYYACQDSRTPLWIKLLAIVVVAYAFSPVDLVPDFIPVLGYLDDLILLPLGIVLVIWLLPDHVLEDSRKLAESKAQKEKPRNWIAGVVVILLWVVLAGLLIGYVFEYVREG
jgi:uncharacterized membrane protein YkvA (DUF1232 family)